MDVPPNIPTSFVPRQTAPAGGGRAFDFSGAFAFLSYILLGAAVLAAVGVFAYGQYLGAAKASKDAAIAKAEAAIDPATVESFLALRDRLASGKTLLAEHIALSNFFTLLESLTPATVRFSGLTATLAADHSMAIAMTGSAKSFNALAAESAALATNAGVKNAIFSNIAVGKDGSVAFSLAASLDPSLTAFAPTPSP